MDKDRLPLSVVLLLLLSLTTLLFSVGNALAMELSLPLYYAFENKEVALNSGGTLTGANRQKIATKPEVLFNLGSKWSSNMSATFSKSYFSAPEGGTLITDSPFQFGGGLGLARQFGRLGVEIRADYIATTVLSSPNGTDLSVTSAHHAGATLGVSQILAGGKESSFVLNVQYTSLQVLRMRDQSSVGVLGGNAIAFSMSCETGTDSRMGLAIEYGYESMTTEVGKQTGAEIGLGLILRFGGSKRGSKRGSDVWYPKPWPIMHGF